MIGRILVLALALPMLMGCSTPYVVLRLDPETVESIASGDTEAVVGCINDGWRQIHIVIYQDKSGRAIPSYGYPGRYDPMRVVKHARLSEKNEHHCEWGSKQ